MANIFISWSGNEPLAECLEKLIDSKVHDAIVSGGSQDEVYYGEHVIKQINQCSYAILLVEGDGENNAISHNLMFEWGYVMAKFPHNCIYTMFIDKKTSELPQDLQGSWYFPFTRKKPDGNLKTDEQLACEIYAQFIESFQKTQEEYNYFDIVNNWKNHFSAMLDNTVKDEAKLCKYILMGCFSAYYYCDNEDLRDLLDEISGSPTLNEVVDLAIAYVDTFLFSETMSKPITRKQLRHLTNSFDEALERERKMSKDVDLLMDMVCYNAYGLSYLLYLKNDGLDEDVVEEYGDLACEKLQSVLKVLDEFDKVSADDCLNMLIKSYIYNDLAHIHKDNFKDNEGYQKYLDLSVQSRKELHRTFKNSYPNNRFMITKLHQEYMVALSEQCAYIENSRVKRENIDNILYRMEDWQKEVMYSTTLLKRIEKNLKALGVKVEPI